MNDCDHDWRWLGHHHFIVDRDGQVTAYENAECMKCGLRGLLHGHAPVTGTPTQSLEPTTGRS